MKLKPCPWCRETPRFEETRWEHNNKMLYCVACWNMDGCDMEISTAWFATKERAAKAWNKRADGWVSVKERLPMVDGKYLCWDVPYSPSVDSPAFGYFKNGEFETEIASDYSNVTHWMERPGPPKEA